MKDDFHLLKNALENFLARQHEQQESQNEIIPGTQGQELHNISGSSLRRTNKSIFAFKDDDIDDEPTTERDNVVSELNDYKTVRLTATQKIELNLLTLWKNHQHKYPHLFQFVRTKLHIPATSVPSEREHFL